jgi:Spy/CpxP family protein refolding chaperone
MSKKKYLVLLALFTGGYISTFAQASSPNPNMDNYTQVITLRSGKIVDALSITDSVKYKKVRDVIVDQYRSLNDIYNKRNAQSKQIKEQFADDKAAAGAKIADVDSNVNKQLKEQHVEYLSKLARELNPEQVDKVKDGMTYRIYPITYTAYLDELPNLTDPQKDKIKGWLLEARENAIDAESAEKKHAWFGKFKGRINNYLSAQGYDMKAAGEEWQKRIKERNAKN